MFGCRRRGRQSNKSSSYSALGSIHHPQQEPSVQERYSIPKAPQSSSVTTYMEPALTILTGAQTGIDTAAIEAAIRLHLPYEGWVPLGCTNEAGPIASKYRAKLRETPSPEIAQRTEQNMLGSDVVLTILRGPPESARGGTKWGVDVAKDARKRIAFR